MNIGTMLNTKAQLHHHFNGAFDHHSHFPLLKTEPGMERSVSPHGSEHSHYSGHMSRPYGSPGPMQTPMSLSNGMQGQMSLPSFPDMSGMTNVHGMPTMQHMHHPQTSQPQQAHHHHQHHHHQQQQPQQQPQQPQQIRGPQAATKSYPCSTCGKHFARRSDLARHGQYTNPDRNAEFPSTDTANQSASTLASDLMSATLAGRCSSNGPPSQFINVCTPARSLIIVRSAPR